MSLWQLFENAHMWVQSIVLMFVILMPTLLIEWAFNYSSKLRAWSEGTQTSFVTPIALCFGLMSSFTFVEVINMYEKAKSEVNYEAASLDAVLDLAILLPQKVRAPLDTAIRNHLRHMIEEEWPLMRKRTASLSGRDNYLVESYKALATVKTNDPLELELRKEIMAYLELARISATHRLNVSQAHVHPMKWAVLFALAILVQVSLAISHAQTPKSRLLTMLVFSVAVTAYFIIIVAFNHAFGGDVFVSPEPIKNVLEHS